MRRFLLAAFLLGAVSCLEEVPRASGLRSSAPHRVQAPVARPEIRRAPVYKQARSDSLPHAHGLSRVSTGVRRAPQVAATRPPVRAAPKVVRRPMSPMLPLPMLGGVMPIPLPPLIPMNLPMVTLAPHPALPTISLPTMATIEMPTLPSFTMPPSFQRLMGITTPKPAKKARKEESQEEPEPEKEVREEKAPPSEKAAHQKRNKELSSVGSRLAKFVEEPEKVVAPEGKADWIVPFKK